MMFKDVIGHQRIIQQLISNAGNHRVSHAQLFLGSEGSGTLALALSFARYLQCRDKGPGDACGKCPSCLKFDRLEHPDLHFFFPTAPNQLHKKDISSKLFLPQWRELLNHSPYFTYLQWLEKIGVENKQAIINAEDCNNIIRTLGLKSYEGPYKIIVVYMVEKIFYSAAPKVLKVLEEPPSNTLFLMVSENKDMVLNTILSRTQVLRLPPPSEEDIRQALTEKQGLPAHRAREIAFVTAGNYAEALRLTTESGEQIADLEAFREWMRYCYSRDADRILKWVEQIARTGRERQKSFFQYGLKIFRLCLLHNYQAHELLRLEKDEEDFVTKFSPFINHTNLLQIVEAFNIAIQHLERNANPKILFADLSFQLMALMRPQEQ